MLMQTTKYFAGQPFKVALGKDFGVSSVER